jgi:anti-sigma factor RsiW
MGMMNENNEDRKRERIDALLPWYATRRLSDAEEQSVEEALAGDPDAARRLSLVEEERAETVTVNEKLGAPTSRARDRLFERIEAASPRRAPRRIGRFAWASDWISGLSGLSGNVLALPTAALAVLVLLQAGLLGTLLIGDRSGSRFTTASGPEAPGSEGSHVLVAFAPDASAAQITTFLESHHASIVDGPRPGGMFRVRIADKRLSEEEVARVISAMRAQQPPVRIVVPSP